MCFHFEIERRTMEKKMRMDSGESHFVRSRELHTTVTDQQEFDLCKTERSESNERAPEVSETGMRKSKPPEPHRGSNGKRTSGLTHRAHPHDPRHHAPNDRS